MTLRSDSKYPIYRAYVVKLSCDATPDALCGRLENLVSGKHRDFASAGELFELMTADLHPTGCTSPDATSAEAHAEGAGHGCPGAASTSSAHQFPTEDQRFPDQSQ